MEWISIYDKEPIENHYYLVSSSRGCFVAERNSQTWYEKEEWKVIDNVEYYCEITPPKKDHKTIIFE